MNEIECILCNVSSNQIAIEENGYTGKRCPECELIYISPRPSFDQIIDLYGHDDAHISAQAHIDSDFSKSLHARHTINIIHRYISSGSLLEIGSGAGHVLNEARSNGFEPHGLEFNPIQADHIRTTLGIPCEEKSLDESVYGGKKFDLIYHCDVLSHLYDPISDFSKMNDALSENSYLIFETGNLAEIDKKYFKYIRSFMYPDHLFFFSAQNIENLLRKTNFELVYIHKYSLMPQYGFFRFLSVSRKTVQGLLSKLMRKKQHRSAEDINYTVSTEKDARQPFYVRNRFISNSGKLMRHFLRYQFGAIALKTKRPQTIIVVAKKIANPS